MPEIFIDGKRFEYEKPQKVLQFMLDHGMELPFFCFHPSLSIPANCRQCMVQAGTPVFNKEKNEYETDENGERKIRYFPKLMTACSLDMSDGMVVKTHRSSDLVRRAQKDNLEFILINHPLDCPICDQAGECPLQIQTYKYGPEGSRFEFKKVHKPKRVKLGPRVTLDAERCINCTRCVRFCNEISKTNQLTIISRGDKNYPATAPGKEFDDPYSVNTVDICPVGALTSSDFRFKARVWEMNQTPGIDITNGKGTNVDLWTRNNLVLRITPRYNPEVNDYWMPDAGRDAYKLYNENRVSKPEIRLDEENSSKTTWNNALETFLEKITEHSADEILVIGSPHASLEDNYILRKFFNKIGVNDIYYTPHIEAGAGDGFLLTDDQAPNTRGIQHLGFTESEDLARQLSSDKIKVVIVLHDHLLDRSAVTTEALEGKYVISFATNNSEMTKASDLVIPITCAAEHDASYVSIDGRIQRTFPAKETIYTNRSLNPEMGIGRLDRYGTKFDNWITDQNKVDCIPAWEFLMRLSKRMNQDIEFTESRQILDEVASTIPVFEGVSYERIDEENGIQLPELKETEINPA
ncbi:MAG TPA: 2Fe-2S iron-sulfur cluster-binding protein [Balneolales bacterium]|nr:2Fe-2S iron-sulfur cluster-binding protein [Balneolales bacterium]